MRYNSNNMVNTLKSVLMSHPKYSFVSNKKIQKEWENLNYLSPPNFVKANKEFDHLVELIKSFGVDIHFIKNKNELSLDSLYIRDSSIITNHGAIICRMGKKLRREETKSIKKFYIENNVPILGEVSNPGTIEGGDIIWIDDKTIAVGEGYRTNISGINQIKKMLSSFNIKIITVPLPHWKGPDECLHLMSLISPVDTNLYVVYKKLLPVSFINLLLDKNIGLIDIPEEEYNSMACNILAISPRVCIMLNNNPKTKNALDKENVKVFGFSGDDISIKGSGGPTCLTRPLYRH